MGTSSARQGPAGRLWRLARGAATRYLSPESTGAVTAREVAARYAAALGAEGGSGPGGPLAAWRLTRKVAQNLGAFGCQVASRGWPAALSAWALNEAAAEPETLAQSLAAALGTPGGGLEPAAAHAALVRVLLGLRAPYSSAAAWDGAQLGRRFLAAAFLARLTLDLGESLEAVAAGYGPLRQGLRELAACLDQAMESDRIETPAPHTPEAWLGLPGWTWVTQVTEDLLSQLTAPPKSAHDR